MDSDIIDRVHAWRQDMTLAAHRLISEMTTELEQLRAEVAEYRKCKAKIDCLRHGVDP